MNPPSTQHNFDHAIFLYSHNDNYCCIKDAKSNACSQVDEI
jgi:hypothetical protein